MSCLPKIIYNISNSTCGIVQRRVSDGAYHEFSFTREITLLDTDEGVVVLSFTEGSGMDVGCKEAYRREDSVVKCSLLR